jgi:transcriptional regulator with XRE-family HTH domain
MVSKTRGARILRQWRKRRGLSQHQAAEILGIDLMTLSRYERGVVRPNLERALEFAVRTDGEVPVESWKAGEAKAS